MSEERGTFEGWCVLELMGHRKLGGLVSEATIGGGSFIRIDVPGAPGRPGATQFYAPAAVYGITPTTEEIARRLAVRFRPEPVSEWELPKLPSGPVVDVDPAHDDDEGDERLRDADDDADDDEGDLP
jgi:hypothetical protein